MKIAVSIATLLLLTNISYANEDIASGDDDITAYCEEQAQLTGIEGEQPTSDFVQDCISDFTSQAGESTPIE